MKYSIGIFCNGYKDNLNSLEVGKCIKEGFLKGFNATVVVDCDVICVGDGGRGTAFSVAQSLGLYPESVDVTGPLGEPVRATYFTDGKQKAVFDVAEACGLDLVPIEKRNPSKTTTFGVGMILKELHQKGLTDITVGLGDSATLDGGIGMMQGFGAVFYDTEGNTLPEGRFDLTRIARFEVPEYAKDLNILCLCDGMNRLTGTVNIVDITARQKGALEDDMPHLHREFDHINSLFKQCYGIDFSSVDCSGVAGGLGAGFKAFFGGEYINGTTYVSKITKLEERMSDYDLVIVSEGEVNYQTAQGKTPSVIARVAKKYGKPVVFFCAKYGKDFDHVYDDGITLIVNTDPMLIPFESIRGTEVVRSYITHKATEVASLIKNVLEVNA
jgi:glycerate kinase